MLRHLLEVARQAHIKEEGACMDSGRCRCMALSGRCRCMDSGRSWCSTGSARHTYNPCLVGDASLLCIGRH
jgi:hypothetical protein